MEIKSHIHVKGQLYSCVHCNQTGTCSINEDGSSCYTCLKKSEIPFYRTYTFYTFLFKSKKMKSKVTCGTCGGVGVAELLSERIKTRTPMIIAFIATFMFPAIILVSIYTDSEYSNQAITLSSTMLGIVFTYFFTSMARNRK